MRLSNPFSPRWWLLIPFCAALFIVAIDCGQIRHVQRLTGMSRESSATSKTASHRHWLLVPEHNNRSYQWLAETEQMLTRGEWRVRHVDYENAPVGRVVNAASP